jgi:hypothetical protein
MPRFEDQFILSLGRTSLLFQQRGKWYHSPLYPYIPLKNSNFKASLALARVYDTGNEDPIEDTDRPATHGIRRYVPCAHYLASLIIKYCSDDPAWSAIRHPAGWHYHCFDPASIVTDTRRGTFSPVAPGLQDTEVYYGNEGCRWINHKHQAAHTKAVHNEQRSELTFFEKQQYWDYVANHPSHYSEDILRKIVLEGGRVALDYLEWCSQG